MGHHTNLPPSLHEACFPRDYPTHKPFIGLSHEIVRALLGLLLFVTGFLICRREYDLYDRHDRLQKTPRVEGLGIAIVLEMIFCSEGITRLLTSLHQ